MSPTAKKEEEEGGIVLRPAKYERIKDTDPVCDSGVYCYGECASRKKYLKKSVEI